MNGRTNWTLEELEGRNLLSSPLVGMPLVVDEPTSAPITPAIHVDYGGVVSATQRAPLSARAKPRVSADSQIVGTWQLTMNFRGGPSISCRIGISRISGKTYRYVYTFPREFQTRPIAVTVRLSGRKLTVNWWDGSQTQVRIVENHAPRGQFHAHIHAMGMTLNMSGRFSGNCTQATGNFSVSYQGESVSGTFNYRKVG